MAPAGTYQVAGTTLTRTAGLRGRPTADGTLVCGPGGVFRADTGDPAPAPGRRGVFGWTTAADGPFPVLLTGRQPGIPDDTHTARIDIFVGDDPAPVHWSRRPGLPT